MDKSTRVSSTGEREANRADHCRPTLIKILSNSSITGLSRAASVPQVGLKVFWSLLFTSGVIGFSINFNNVLRQHKQEPILTQINNEFATFKWPHMTFCNPSNPIAFWQNPELKEKWLDLKKNVTALNKFLKSQNVSVLEEDLMMSSVSPTEFFKAGIRGIFNDVSIFFRISKKIATSTGTYDSFESMKNFDVAFETHFASSRYPVPCYTVKPEVYYGYGSSKKQDIYGVRVFLLLDFESYRFFNSGYQNRKIYMYLSYPNHTLTSSDPYFISPGTTTHFQVSETYFRRLKNCTDHHQKVEMYNSFLNSTKHYEGVFKDCRFYISQKLFYNLCECQNPSLPIYNLSTGPPVLCLNSTFFNMSQILANIRCQTEVKERYSRGEEFEDLLSQECSNNLQPKCEQPSHSFVRRTNIWPTSINERRKERLVVNTEKLPNAIAFKNVSNQNVTEDFALQNCAIVNVHRSTDRSSLIFEELEYPLAEFLSDVGGLLGLWLGLSVISVFELLELLIMFLVGLFKRLVRVDTDRMKPKV